MAETELGTVCGVVPVRGGAQKIGIVSRWYLVGFFSHALIHDPGQGSLTWLGAVPRSSVSGLPLCPSNPSMIVPRLDALIISCY